METVNEHSSLLLTGQRRSSTNTTRRTSVTAHDVLIKNETYDDDEDRMHGLSSAIITSTHVLLQPNFAALDDDNDENIDDNDTEAAATPSPRRVRRPLQVRRKSSIVLSSRGTIASPGGQRMFQSGGRRKSVRVVQGMINAVSTSSVLNLVVASAGGVGMITLPGSFAQIGYGYGILFLLLSCLCAASSLVLLDWCCKAVVKIAAKSTKPTTTTGTNTNTTTTSSTSDSMTSSYAGLVAFTLGSFGSQTLEWLTLVFCIGMVIGNLGAISNQLVVVLSLVDITITQAMATLIEACVIMFPLSLLPEESSMRFAGIIGSACMMYVIGTIFYGDGVPAIRSGTVCALSENEGDSTVDTTATMTTTTAFTSSLVLLLQNAPLFLFALNGSTAYIAVRYHHVTLLQHLLGLGVGGINRTPTTTAATATIQHETKNVILFSVSAGGFCYLLTCCVVYIAFCNDVPENVVDAWPIMWLSGTIARGCIIIQLTAAACGIWVPLGRAALWHLIYGPYETVPAAGSTRILITVILIATGAYVSIALGGALALPLAITSALCVTAQMFILPGLCCLKLLRLMNEKKKTSNTEYDIDTILGGQCFPLLFTIFGTIFGVLSLAALFGLL